MTTATDKISRRINFAGAFLVALGVLILSSIVVRPGHAFHFPWDQGHDSTDWMDPDDPGPCDGPFCEQDPNDCNGKGSPVYVSTGYLNWLDSDVVLNGRPFLGITRSYQSNDPRTGLFGNGWSFDHDKSLLVTTGQSQNAAGRPTNISQVVLHAGNGKRFMWQYQGQPGQLNPRSRPQESPSGVFVNLVFAANGSVRLNGRDGAYEIYDNIGRLSQRTDRNGNKLRYGYRANGLLRDVTDEHGRRLSFRYNSKGLVASVTDHTRRQWKYTYDRNGNLIGVTDPLGNTRRYRYQPYTSEADGFTYYQLIKVVDESGVTVTDVEYDSSRVAAYTEGSNRWAYDYRPDRRTTTKTDTSGYQETYTYDEKGLIVEFRDNNRATTKVTRNDSGLITSITDPLGNTWQNNYDRYGRRVSSTDALGNVVRFRYTGTNPWPTTVISPSGRRQQTQFDARGNLVAMVDAAGVRTTLNWNARGDLQGGRSGTGTSRTLRHNGVGLPTVYTDELNRATQYRYDRRGNLAQLTEPNGAITRFRYDVLDRVVTTTNPAGNVLRSRYDPAGRLLAVTDEKGNVTRHTYDQYGRHRERISPENRRIVWSYGVDNLPSEVTLDDGTAVTFNYDSGRRIVEESIGGDITRFTYNLRDELTSTSNDSGIVSLSYDANGRKVQERYSGEVIAWEYNKDNERTKLSALGETTNYSRDRRGYITAITGPAGRFDFKYDKVGRRQQTNYPNGCRTQLRYDRACDLASMSFSGGFNANYRFQRNKLGLTSAWSGAPEGEWRYGYDRNNRLVNARHGTNTIRFRYDKSGNRLENGSVYNSANRLIEK